MRWAAARARARGAIRWESWPLKRDFGRFKNDLMQTVSETGSRSEAIRSGCFSCLFHRGSVFATTCGAVTFGAMKESLLRGFHVGFFALPEFQSRLLDG